MGKRSPERLGDILKKVWGKIEKQKEERAEISKVLDGMGFILGRKASAHIKPHKIYRKKLIIKVNSPVYLQEILFKKEKIIEAANRALGKEKIRDVSFRVE
jgi:hypothetical protein